MLTDLFEDLFGPVVIVIVIVIMAIIGNAYVTHERAVTYRACIAQHQDLAECKSIKP